MNVGSFKKYFSEIAVRHDWLVSKRGWITQRRDSDECTVAIDLQKSSYGKQFYVNIHVYIHEDLRGNFDQGLSFDSSVLTAYRRAPNVFSEILDLTSNLNDDQRCEGIERLFLFLAEFVSKSRTRKGLIELEGTGMIFLAPGVRAEVERLINECNV